MSELIKGQLIPAWFKIFERKFKWGMSNPNEPKKEPYIVVKDTRTETQMLKDELKKLVIKNIPIWQVFIHKLKQMDAIMHNKFGKRFGPGPEIFKRKFKWGMPTFSEDTKPKNNLNEPKKEPYIVVKDTRTETQILKDELKKLVINKYPNMVNKYE